MIFCLDTNVLIDIINSDRTAVREQYDAAVASGDEIVTSTLVAHELLFGAAISRRPDLQTRWAETMLADMQIYEWTLADAKATIPIRRHLRSQGMPIGMIDLLIAGQVLDRGWTLISANLSHFDRVAGLRVLDWTRPIPPTSLES